MFILSARQTIYGLIKVQFNFIYVEERFNITINIILETYYDIAKHGIPY